MCQFNCSRILIFTFVILCVYSDTQFNSLSEKLALSLMKITPNKNIVVSEHLVRTSLCKLASIATGDTRYDLMNILGYRDEVALNKCYSNVAQFFKIMKMSDLVVTNRIYLNYTSDIDPNFIKDSSEKYGVQVEKVGFNYPKAAIAHINNLLSSMTFRRITDIVDTDDINRTTKMIIVSGANFKATWTTRFDYRLTKLARFNLIDGRTIKIPMMNTMGEYLYRKAPACEILSMRLLSYDTYITFVVPDQAKALGNLLETIYKQKDFVTRHIKAAEMRLMKISIPRFKIKTYVDWTGFLQGLGLNSVFYTNSTDLVEIYKEDKQNQTINLSKVKQKVFIQIDEMGVHRRLPDETISDVKPKDTSMIHCPKFIADKPFYFEVSLDFDGGRYDVFAGVYYGPEPDLPSF